MFNYEIPVFVHFAVARREICEKVGLGSLFYIEIER